VAMNGGSSIPATARARRKVFSAPTSGLTGGELGLSGAIVGAEPPEPHPVTKRAWAITPLRLRKVRRSISNLVFSRNYRRSITPLLPGDWNSGFTELTHCLDIITGCLA
jgi:hypothetical protein